MTKDATENRVPCQSFSRTEDSAFKYVRAGALFVTHPDDVLLGLERSCLRNAECLHVRKFDLDRTTANLDY